MLPFDQTIIIIPTYNEIENIEKMNEKIFLVNSELSLLIVDDGSPDGTAEKIQTLQKKFLNLHLLQRGRKLGLGTAYIEGFRWGLKKHFNYFFEMDCDFSHDPDDIPKILKAALDHELAIGSRYIDGIRVINWPPQRLMLSLFASFYTRAITGLPVMDTTGGFKCLTRKALSALDLEHFIFRGYAFQIEINFRIWSKNMRLTEVPIIFYERRVGKSKMNKSLVIEAFFGVLLLRMKKILKML